MKDVQVIEFDDPEEIEKPSEIALLAMASVDALDYVRRKFERAGDPASMKRANDIRKSIGNILDTSMFILHDIIPDDDFDEYVKSVQWRTKRQ